MRRLAAVSLLVPLALLGAATARSQSQTQAAPVTLTVSIAGTGIGVVTSYPAPLTYPAGISCPSVCSAQFADGTLVDLHAQADDSSNPVGFSTSPPYDCGPVYVPFPPPGTIDCTITMDSQLGSTATVRVTFNRKPVDCTVPAVRGRTLAKARALIRGNHCRVGSITRVLSHKVKKGRVISQNPAPHAQRAKGAIVNLVVSRGRG